MLRLVYEEEGVKSVGDSWHLVLHHSPEKRAVFYQILRPRSVGRWLSQLSYSGCGVLTGEECREDDDRYMQWYINIWREGGRRAKAVMTIGCL